MAISDRDLVLLQRSFAVASQSRQRGDHPFGAILTGPDGAVLMEAMNTCGTKADRTGHAERNLMTRASQQYEAAFMRQCTMYTSAEPCAMCAGAAYWAGLGRIVYGLSEKRLKDFIGPNEENLTMNMPCREVLATGQREISIEGPLLEDEALEIHKGFW
ncbi:MAG: nucleoside deaminase [Beijerinckiaceae bacterium]